MGYTRSMARAQFFGLLCIALAAFAVSGEVAPLNEENLSLEANGDRLALVQTGASRRGDDERREEERRQDDHKDMGESASTGTTALTKAETKALSTSVAAQTADLDASQFAYDPEIRATRAFSKLDDAMDSLSTVLGPSMKKKKHASEGDVELLQVGSSGDLGEDARSLVDADTALSSKDEITRAQAETAQWSNMADAESKESDAAQDAVAAEKEEADLGDSVDVIEETMLKQEAAAKKQKEEVAKRHNAKIKKEAQDALAVVSQDETAMPLPSANKDVKETSETKEQLGAEKVVKSMLEKQREQEAKVIKAAQAKEKKMANDAKRQIMDDITLVKSEEQTAKWHLKKQPPTA